MDVPALDLPPSTILIIEDNEPIANMLRETLELEGYTALVALTGEDGLVQAQRRSPQVILLDLMLPGIDGFEVLKRLHANVATAHIPVLVLSARHDVDVRVRALESANDYLAKPFDGGELLARIRTQLRSLRASMLSPLTGLPGGLAVEQSISQALRSQTPWAVLYLDLDNFKAYNDVYGFLKGNELIRLLARVAGEVITTYGNPTDFLGHIGGDDFIIVTAPENVPAICYGIESAWDRESRAEYSAEDLRRGSLIAVDRDGVLRAFPLVAVSIGVVTNVVRPLSSMEEFSRLAAALKKRAKQVTGSTHFIDDGADDGAPHTAGTTTTHPTPQPDLRGHDLAY